MQTKTNIWYRNIYFFRLNIYIYTRMFMLNIINIWIIKKARLENVIKIKHFGSLYINNNNNNNKHNKIKCNSIHYELIEQPKANCEVSTTQK
jgi:hypothetical protein